MHFPQVTKYYKQRRNQMQLQPHFFRFSPFLTTRFKHDIWLDINYVSKIATTLCTVFFVIIRYKHQIFDSSLCSNFSNKTTPRIMIYFVICIIQKLFLLDQDASVNKEIWTPRTLNSNWNWKYLCNPIMCECLVRGRYFDRE